jgi:hypothetical protein
MSALAMGVAVCGFRVLTDGGLTNDHFMHLAWAQQVLLGDMPYRDFVEPGMPLMYLLSAAVQQLWAGPFSEIVLTSAMLGIAAAATCWLVTRMTGSLLLGALAVIAEAILQPRLYGYPKILVPPVVLVALWHYAEAPSRRRLLWLAGASVFGGLLRYDLGLFAVISCLGGLLAMPGTPAATRLRHAGAYAALALLIVAPYLLAVHWTSGLWEQVRESLEFAKAESHQFLLRLDEQPWVAGWPNTDENAAAFLYYAGGALAAAGAGLLVLARRGLSRAQVVTLTATTICLACYSVWIVRHPIIVRVRDNGALIAILTASCGSVIARRLLASSGGQLVMTGAAWTALVAVVGVGSSSIVELARMDAAFERSHILKGMGKMQARLTALATAGAAWPWPRYWPQGELPDAVRYLNSCVQPSERVLLTWSAPEYYYFSQRGFGAGIALFLPPRAFTTAADQEKMQRRLDGQNVPLVLINETRRHEFAMAYPQVDRYLRERYVPDATFVVRDGSNITIAVRNDLAPSTSFEQSDWPCDLIPKGF